MAPAQKTRAKGKKGKKGGKKGRKTGAVRPTASLHTLQSPPQSELYVQEDPYQRRGKKGTAATCLLVWLVVFSYIAATVLGVLVAEGCVTNTTGIKDIYIAEITANDTYDFSLRVGYFGGCITIAEPDSPSSSSNSSDTFTQCVRTMRDKDVDDLSEEFWESLDSGSGSIQAYVQTALDGILPYVQHLQNDIFYWQPPVLHATFFFFSGALLIVARAGMSHRKVYKGVLLGILTVAAFALALSLATVLGSLQALNALLEGSSSTDESQLSDDFFISRGDTMHVLQAATVAVAAVFYVLMGMLFVRRTPAVGVVFQMFQRAGGKLREKGRR